MQGKDQLSRLCGVLFLYLIGYAATSTTYTRQGDPSLTVIPFHEIPASVVTVELDDCEIEDVDYFPYFPSLGTLSMKSNRLTVLPDFSNISSSLSRLYLKYNNISYVDPTRLDALTNLEYLSLGGNYYLTHFPDCTVPGGIALNNLQLYPVPLLEFPDLPCLGKSLQYVSFGGFKFGSVPDSRLLNLVKLSQLLLSHSDLTEFPRAELLNKTLGILGVPGTKIKEIPTERIPAGTLNQLYIHGMEDLTTIPNLCSVMPSGSSIFAKNLDLVCDCRLLWLLDAIAVAEINIDLTGTYCDSPPNLGGMLVSQLVHSDLLCNAGSYP